MAATFNADEIFEMAEEVERSAAKFYRQASRQAAEDATRRKLLDLAAMEDGHLKTFQEMRKALTPAEKEDVTFDPENQALLYLHAMAAGHGTEGKKSRTEKLTGKETIKELLQIAVGAEKDSIVFYSSMREMVPENGGRERVEGVIREEIGHLAVLKQNLAQFK